MATRQNSGDSMPRKRRPPAKTPEARENQMISMAFDLAEKRMMAGTASAQEITHFLKLGSSRERLEQQRLEKANMLADAKIEFIENDKVKTELYREALDAMRRYSGANSGDDYE